MKRHLVTGREPAARVPCGVGGASRLSASSPSPSSVPRGSLRLTPAMGLTQSGQGALGWVEGRGSERESGAWPSRAVSLGQGTPAHPLTAQALQGFTKQTVRARLLQSEISGAWGTELSLSKSPQQQ